MSEDRKNTKKNTKGRFPKNLRSPLSEVKDGLNVNSKHFFLKEWRI
jgi:hypothetical protein